MQPERELEEVMEKLRRIIPQRYEGDPDPGVVQAKTILMSPTKWHKDIGGQIALLKSYRYALERLNMTDPTGDEKGLLTIIEKVLGSGSPRAGLFGGVPVVEGTPVDDDGIAARVDGPAERRHMSP